MLASVLPMKIRDEQKPQIMPTLAGESRGRFKITLRASHGQEIMHQKQVLKPTEIVFTLPIGYKSQQTINVKGR